MSNKIQVGDKVLWGETVYTIEEIKNGYHVHDQILFSWFCSKRNRRHQIYHSNVNYVQDAILRGEIQRYQPMAIRKKISKFRF